MKFKKQQQKFYIDDLESQPERKRWKNGTLLPESLRCLVCGPSSCGKTNLMINLLTNLNGLKFENLYVFSKTLFQPKYILLKEMMKLTPEVEYKTFENSDDVPHPSQIKPYSTVIFDDVICDKQDNMRLYFCLGRHKNIDMFYLTQCYTKVPKHLLRENTNFIILFRQDLLNLQHVYSDFVNTDMSFKTFQEICQECWIVPHGFVVIDTQSDIKKGKYRRGLDEFVFL